MTESPDETTPRASAADEPAPYRVLVVEDDRSQALFAQSVLSGAGAWRGGSPAWEAAQRASPSRSRR